MFYNMSLNVRNVHKGKVCLNEMRRVFINVKKNETYNSFGVGILTCEGFGSSSLQKAWALRFLNLPKLNRDEGIIRLHQLCSIIYVFQKCNTRPNLIYMDPFYNCDDNVEIVPYINTVFSLLRNKNINFERSKSMYYPHLICNKLAYFASDLNNNQGIYTDIKLCGGKKISLKFLFNE